MMTNRPNEQTTKTTQQRVFCGRCKNSTQRIEHFVSDFIRSEYVEGLTNDRDNDFWNEPERAARVYDAAAEGCDGKTHAEVIGDWRDAFTYWMRDQRRGYFASDPERFIAAVNNYFDDVEVWHEKNGSLWQEIG